METNFENTKRDINDSILSDPPPRIVMGVATIPKRNEFFTQKVLPNLKEMAGEVWVYRDDPERPILVQYSKFGSSVVEVGPQSVGDAGKFLGAQLTKSKDFYYFSCDDDLIYPLDYAKKMIAWIEFLDRKCAVSLHASTFSSMPIFSYYKQKKTIPCLGTYPRAQRVLFPGTGALAFHSSVLKIKDVTRQFPTRNMADVWMGKVLQEQGVPAIVLPHSAEYLTYNIELSTAETIYGQEFERDFLQTAVINQVSLNPGLQLFPLVWPDETLPPSLGDLPEGVLQNQLAPEVLFQPQVEQSEESDTSGDASGTDS